MILSKLKLPLFLTLTFVILGLAVKDKHQRNNINNSDVRNSVLPVNHPVFTNRTIGTSFVVSFFDSTFLVTNFHLCSHGLLFGRIMVNGLSEKILAYDRKNDSCILTYSGSEKALELDHSLRSLKVDETLKAIGFPAGKGRITMSGTFRETFQSIYSLYMYCMGGCIGSPVLDKHNKVVGVVFAVDRNDLMDTLVIPISHVINLLIKVKILGY